MWSIMQITLKGVFRDRIFQGIFMTSLIFLFIPAVASLSMRQVTELTISMSLSMVSFILLLLALFLGGTTVWRDLERRYSYSILGLPLRRSSYLLGKFAGIALFIAITALFLSGAMFLVVTYGSAIYPSERPVLWSYLFLAIFFDLLKYMLLIAVAFLFSTVSTSFFLPIFGTIAIYFVGSASQEAFDFIHTPGGRNLSGLVRALVKGLYYVLPNFSAFDLKINAIYGVKVSLLGLLYTFGYFSVYTAIVLFLASMVFSHRELK